MKKLLAALALTINFTQTFSQTYNEITFDKDELIKQENPIEYLRDHYAKDSTDIFVSSGPFAKIKTYKFSTETLDKLGFELLEETGNKVLLRNCKTRELFELSARFGSWDNFTISWKKFSKATARRIPYLKYGCP
jgi:hypothetical protein